MADVYLGRAAVQLPTSEVIEEPLLWLRTMAEHRVTHSWTPNFGFKLVAAALEEAPHLAPSIGDLSRLRCLMNAGEQVTAEVCNGFLERTGLPPRVMQPAFGMAECCTCMTYNHAYAEGRATVRVVKASLQSASLRLVDSPSPSSLRLAPPPSSSSLRLATADSRADATLDRNLEGNLDRNVDSNLDRHLVASFVDLGPPSPGVEIRICAPPRHGDDGTGDSNGKGSGNGSDSGAGAAPRVLRELQVGHLQIRGACVMAGYHEHPTATAESMVGDGWLETGDLGFLEQGRLVLTGRAKEVVIVRGANFYCYEVEDAAATVAGVATARVAATSVRDERLGTEVLLVFFVPAEPLHLRSLAHLHADGVLVEPLRRLVAAVRSQLGVAFGLAPRYAVPVAEEDFHRTTAGKIQRGAFKRAFEGGRYSRALAALDLSLHATELASQDLFAAAVLLPRPPPPPPSSSSAAAARVARVVLLAPASMLEALRGALACEASVVGYLDGSDLSGLGALLAAARPTHLVHALLLGGHGAAAATLCEVARALGGSDGDAAGKGGQGGKGGQDRGGKGGKGRGGKGVTLLCVRHASLQTPQQTLRYMSEGAAMAPAMCKAVATELGPTRIARAATLAL